MKEMVKVVAVSSVRLPQGQRMPEQFSGMSDPLQITVSSDKLNFMFVIDGAEANPRCGDFYQVEIIKVPDLGAPINL